MITINSAIEQLKQKVNKIKNTATERSYYPLLCSFLESYAKSNLKFNDPRATPEETSTQHDKHVGFPDITMRNGNNLIGWIEVKNPKENLTAEKFTNQFSKYKDSLENIIFTNLREWQLWQWVKEDGENDIDATTSLLVPNRGPSGPAYRRCFFGNNFFPPRRVILNFDGTPPASFGSDV